MFSRHAVSVRENWNALLQSSQQNLLNEHVAFLQSDGYAEGRRNFFDRDSDYRPAEYFIADALLLLTLGKGGERPAEILRWAETIAARVHAGNPETIVMGSHTTPSAVAFISIARLKALLHLAIARTALDTRAPDWSLLRDGAAAMELAYAGFRGRLHDVDRKGLMLGVLCALLAQDAVLAKRLLAHAKTCPSHPRHRALFKHIVSASTPLSVDGRTFLRCADASVEEEFVSLFNIYRLPLDSGRADLIGEGKRFETPLASTPVGNYLYAWLYLQTFAETPTTQTDWRSLSEIMTG